MVDENRKHEAEEKAEPASHDAKAGSDHTSDATEKEDVEAYGEKAADPPDASGGT
jgi:hypothetical protein